MEKTLSSINNILNKLYSAIKQDGYKYIDNISSIKVDIFNKEPLKTICLEKNINSFILILNCILSFILLYYAFKTLLSMYSEIYVSSMYKFLIKAIIVLAISSNSYTLCKEIVNINSVLTFTIKSYLSEVSGEEISYKFLEDNVDNLEDVFKVTNKIGIKGIEDSIVCYFILAMIVFFSVRYVIIIFSIIISPIAIILSLTSLTRKCFYIWLKMFTINLVIETINNYIIFIPIASKKEKDIYPAILIGSVILIFKICQRIGKMEIYGKN